MSDEEFYKHLECFKKQIEEIKKIMKELEVKK